MPAATTRLPTRASLQRRVGLGNMYDRGEGVAQGYTEAARWYCRAADQGHAVAQYNLDALLGRGTSVDRDYVEAEKWYEMAAEQGLPSPNTVSESFMPTAWGAPKTT